MKAEGTGKTALLFAGQGSQTPGMGLDFYEKYEAFRQVFDLLPEGQRKIAFYGPAEALSDTRNTQPCMVAFAAGVWALLQTRLEERGIAPAMAAGLSLGEYSALCSAGVFSPEEAIRLVTFRANAMYEAAKNVDCAMMAVLQLDRESLADCCRAAAAETGGTAEIANYNCPGQIVMAGTAEAIERAAALALEKGAKRCLPLAVSGPFHTSFMKPAGAALAQIFQSAAFEEMKYPVFFNATGLPLQGKETVADLLVRQVQSSVFFEDSLRYMSRAGAGTFIEIGPGKALSGFVKKTCPGARVLNISKVSDLDQIDELAEEKSGEVTI